MGITPTKVDYSMWEYCGDNTSDYNIKLYQAIIGGMLPESTACICSKISRDQYYIYDMETMDVISLCGDCILEYKAKPRRCINCNIPTNNTKYRYCDNCGKIKYKTMTIYKFDIMTQCILCKVCGDVYDIVEYYHARPYTDAIKMIYACSQIGDDIIQGHCTNSTCAHVYKHPMRDVRIELIKKQFRHVL